MNRQQITAFTTKELAAEAEREVVMRKVVYAGRVAAGKMRQDTAARQTALMQEIARRLRAVADDEVGRGDGRDQTAAE
jgi:hypothetical protein